jgi:uncharacterized SAM-binding protein YcdF (DUF218 family)
MRKPRLLRRIFEPPKEPPSDQKPGRQLMALWWAIGFFSAVIVLFGTTLWMAGIVYSELPPKAQLDENYEPSDVIVCLTGGRGRIRKALELYEKGYGKMLYISGTDRQVHMKEILKELKWVGPVDDSHIILENVSTNTIGNAEQVNRYVREQGLQSILLVTSIYHVRRAHYIFRKILPREVKIDVTWFEQGPFLESSWWTEWNGIWVTVSEFFKFFYAYLSLPSS